MRILLDTHTVLWAAKGSLSPAANKLLEDSSNELFFSSVNIWEVELKRQKLDIDTSALTRLLLENGYKELPVTSRHVFRLTSLPDLHRDPFDRILLSQALCEGLLLLTADSALKQYAQYVDAILGYDA